ncbi:thioester domain-containing protein, partial [Kitasatospora sp. NPDC059803]|uniref:thioester domain-containing protein n=1 Tax=Kitasatospora sp. NPDC059803 TaxID=3346953 RepID=UPI003666865E
MKWKCAIRAAAVALATGVLAVGGLAPTGAGAADGGADGAGPGVFATVVVNSRIAAGGGFVSFGDSKDDGAEGGLIEVTTADHSSYLAYSLDARSTMKPGSAYDVDRWSGVPTLKGNADAGKVNWILQHGYPAVPLGKLKKLAQGKLTAAQAATATQAAIWRITNRVKGVLNSPAPDRLVDYLVSHAVDVEEPAVALSLSPNTVTGKAGSVLGPIRITTTGYRVTALLDPVAVAAGVVLTDRAGNVLSDGGGMLIGLVKNGDSLFVKAPAGAKSGSATVSAATVVPVRGGLSLVSPDSQPLILLPSDTTFGTTTNAKASWTAAASSPSPTATPSDSTSPSLSPSSRPSQSASPTATGAPTATGTPTATGAPSGGGAPPPAARPPPQPGARGRGPRGVGGGGGRP